MENVLANIFYRIFSTLLTLFSHMKQRWWVLHNRDKVPELLKLQKRVTNELKKKYGIILPTKFIITYWSCCAFHDPNTDTIYFPLAYLNPKFRFHGDSCLGYIRHEYGHACIEHHWMQIGVNGFREIFGDYHQKYEEWLFICWRKRRFDWKNYITKYAQVHPIEDFAECFFIYLQKRGDVEYLKKRRIEVYEKMQYVKKILETLSEYDFSAYNDV